MPLSPMESQSRSLTIRHTHPPRSRNTVVNVSMHTAWTLLKHRGVGCFWLLVHRAMRYPRRGNLQRSYLQPSNFPSSDCPWYSENPAPSEKDGHSHKDNNVVNLAFVPSR